MLKQALLVCWLALAAMEVTAQTDITCRTDAYPPPVQDKVEWFTVDLDDAPEERFRAVAQGRQAEIRNLLKVFKDFIGDFGPQAEKLVNYVDNNMGNLDKDLPYPFAGEIRGIAKYSGLNLGEVVLYNLIYEFSTFCTSIVAEDPAGNLVHARNLDFGFPFGWDIQNKTWSLTEALRPLVVNLEFKRGGTTLFKSVNFAGYVGILTGIKPGIFTFSMNARGGEFGIGDAVEWLLGNRTSQWMGLLTRDVLENGTSYLEAKKLLTASPMLVPAYFILGGNSSGEGCVITRSSSAALDVWEMREVSEHPWFVLETNYDHWKAPLFLDDRRTPATHCMANITQKNVGFEGIYNVLSTIPVLNKVTSYTALMEVRSGRLDTYIRDCKDPCFPW